MTKLGYLSVFAILLFSACKTEDPVFLIDEAPVVQAESSFAVLVQEDIIYAEGLAHNSVSDTSFTIPIKLDVYSPDNNSSNRPVFMFIHGGGFTGGIKHKPEIVDMANFYASRGWVFVSVDYRTTEELGQIQGMTEEELVNYYKGMVSQEWIEFTLDGATSAGQVQQSSAMYLAQRDCKSALRWIVANADTYNINTDFITVGGASAGAITTIALGISNPEDFRDEVSVSDDPTLLTTNLNQSYQVKSMVYFWGSNIKLDVFEGVYGVYPYDRNDPELFMAHGNKYDPVTPYEGALELEDIYGTLEIHSELVTLDSFGHGAWDAEVNGKGLSELSFDFLVDRQDLNVE